MSFYDLEYKIIVIYIFTDFSPDTQLEYKPEKILSKETEL